MFSLLKSGRRQLYPLLLLVVLLLAGCSQAQPDTAGGGSAPPAATGSAQTPRPEGTGRPSATADGLPASSSGAAPAGAVPTAVTEPAPVTATAKPAGPTPAVTGKPAEPAPAATSKPAGPTPAVTGKPAEPAPAVTSKPAEPAPAATSKPAVPAPAATTPVNTVTLSITGDEEHGVILAPAAYEAGKNESALELLKRITRKHKIQMEYQGSGAFAYVEGIDNLYEYDHGAESGWMYKVNGEFPTKAAGSWKMSPGDTIEWLYTLDLGKDLGAPSR